MKRGWMKCILGLIALAFLVAPAHAWYPRTAIAEDGTATWCVYCPFAYAGLEVNKGWFDTSEFNVVRYYASSGALGNATSTARLNYYHINAFPTVIFGGTVPIVGGDPTTAQGYIYRNAIEGELAKPTFFRLTVNSVSFASPTGSIDMDVEVMEDVPSILGMNLRIMLAEDDVIWGSETEQEVCRTSVPDVAISVDQVGEVQNIVRTFTVDPSWVPGKLKILAFVQQDSDKQIYASVSSKPAPAYAMRYYALGHRSAVGDPSPSTAFVFEPFRVYNTGSAADNYSISVAFDGPGDWSAIVCDTNGICYGPTYSTALNPGEYIDLVVDLWPHSSGSGVATVTLTQDNMTPGHERTLRYQYVTNDAEVLLVDDDGGEAYEAYFEDAIGHFGHTYAVWNRTIEAPVAADLASFPILVWNLGWSFPTLDADDRAALGTFLDNGGRLFVTGQDLGWELNDGGGAGYAWFQQYLHARYLADNSGDRTLDGVPADPISDGLDLVIQGGDGANNQLYPDVIATNDAYATPVFKYDATRVGAIKADTGVYKIVYFGFGFEAIDNAIDRRAVMQSILRWFEGSQDAPDGTPVLAAMLRAFPSVVSSSSTVRFALPTAGRASLQVFSTDGRLIRTLADETMSAGAHALVWDGKDDGGARAAAGVYCYRLEGAGTNLQQKVVVVN